MAYWLGIAHFTLH